MKPGSQALSVRNLVKRFRRTIAVDDVSFDVAKGEIVALLGPNGAGKSTTFQCLAGLLRPDSGAIAFDGLSLGNTRGRTISLIPETPEVYEMLTVWEHLAFVAKSCALSPGWEDRAQTLLSRFGMLAKRDELGQALSKGMKQKTLIAATVLADAPAILFDEPMIGLDPLGQRELREIMNDLRAGGKSVMMSTHMLASAQAICSRVVIMKSGRIVYSGTFEELRSGNPTAPDLEQIFLELTA
ncbi:MAG: ABC transporter ATP-binding protein [Vulcanimicrobiaceae bacterium]